MKDKTIFVQMASYRDPQLIPTLNDLIGKALHASRLRVVVCWQHSPDESLEDFLDAGFEITEVTQEKAHSVEYQIVKLTKNEAKVELIDVDYHSSKGACWARNLIQQFYAGEDYTLQLDSHHRFVEMWDGVAIKMLESLRGKSKKPLLTAYIPSFDPENDPKARVMEPWKMDFDRFIPEGAVFFLPSTMDKWEEINEPMRARFYSAHFCFADGSFAVEVQHDPEYFFHGEEISIAVRAFTWGYDLYHPHRVIAWHEYTRKGRVKVWDDHSTTQKNKGKIDLDWVERNEISHYKNRELFGMEQPRGKEKFAEMFTRNFDKYGFGPHRTLRDYEEYSGLSFAHKGIQQQVLDKAEPVYPPLVKYKTEKDWIDSFVGSHDIRILIPRSEIEQVDDFDFWYVGAHNKDGVELFRKDWDAAKISTVMKNEWIDERFIFLHKDVPVTYTIWTHSKSRGWLTKIDKVITD